MEDFIYILIGIAWIAYSLYSQGQKQKRKQQSQPETEPEEELSGVEQNLQSFIDKKLNLDQIFEVDEPDNEYLDSPYSKIDVVEEKDESSYFKPATEGSSAFKADEAKKAKPVIVVEEEFIEDDESDERRQGILFGDDEFDLKKAVIYSEILNPPYIKH